jgi:hypothetical protein
MTDYDRWRATVRAANKGAKLRTIWIPYNPIKVRYQVWTSMRRDAKPLGTDERTPGAAWRSAAERIERAD